MASETTPPAQPEAVFLAMPAAESWTPEQIAWFRERLKAAMANPGPLRVLPSDHWKDRAEAAERQLEHAKAALAGDHEGIRLWMLDCGELVAKHRARAEAADAKLAAIAAYCREHKGAVDFSWMRAGDILAIAGSEEEADRG